MPLALTGAPLVPSRSLGSLVGMRALSFKLESIQPTGSWLDRAAAHLVGELTAGPRTVLGVVGAGPASQALAAQCARIGRQLVALVPLADSGQTGWLEAFGARVLTVDADDTTLRDAAPGVLATVGGRYVDPCDAAWQAGLLELRGEISTEQRADALLALPSLLGQEATWLALAAREGQAAVPLPLDGLGGEDERRILAVVGTEGEAFGRSSRASGIVQQPVCMREALAAQRLLAREEGIITSVWGAAGLAALFRVVQDDRREPLRARRLPRELSAVVVVTRELCDPGGPPLAPNELPKRTVSLAELQAGPAHLLIDASS